MSGDTHEVGRRPLEAGDGRRRAHEPDRLEVVRVHREEEQRAVLALQSVHLLSSTYMRATEFFLEAA